MADDVLFVNSKAAAEATNLLVTTHRIYIHYPQGDMVLRLVGSEPSHPGKLQTLDGSWFEAFEFLTPEFFGAGGSDDTLAFHALGLCITGIGGGCTVKFGSGLTYTIYTTLPILLATPRLVDLVNVHDVVIDFNGSTWSSPLVITTTAEGNCILLSGSSYVTVKGYRCLSATLTVTAWLSNGNNLYGFFSHVSVGINCHHVSVSGYAQGGLNGFYTFRDVTAAADHSHHINFDITCLDTFYPISHQGGARQCRHRIDATNVGRSFFPSNTQDFYAEIRLRGAQVISPCVVLTCVYDSIDPSSYIANGHIKMDLDLSSPTGAMVGLILIPGNNGARGYASPERGRIENVVIDLNGVDVTNISGLVTSFGFRARTSNGSLLGYQLGEPEDGHYVKAIRVTGHASPDWYHGGGGDLFSMFIAQDGFGPNSSTDVTFDGFKAPYAGSMIGLAAGQVLRVGPYAEVAVNNCDFRSGQIVWEDPLYVGMSGASGTFAASETVTGGTSGATGVTIGDFNFYGATPMAYHEVDGRLVLFGPSSTPFQLGETITGGTSGVTAVVTSLAIGHNGTLRENVRVKDSWIDGKLCSSPTGAALQLHSTAIPTSPQQGDVWTESNLIKARLGGVTKALAAATDVLFADSKADAEAETLFTTTNRLYIHYAQCDMPLRKVGSEPSHPGKLQTADGTWFEAYSLLCPEFFGAVGDNSTDDTTAMNNLFTCAQALGTGWTVLMRNGAQYAILAAQAVSTNGWQLTDQTNFRVDFNGAQVRTKYTAAISVGILFFYRCKRFQVYSYSSYQDGYSIVTTHSTLFGDSGLTLLDGCEDVDILNYFQHGGVRGIAAIKALGSGDARCRSIRFNAQTVSVHYPFSDQSSGDDVTGYLDTEDAGRSVILYNCRGVRLFIKSNGSPYSQDCALEAVGHPSDVSVTEDIDIHYHVRPNTTGNQTCLVMVLKQDGPSTLGTPIMRGVRVHQVIDATDFPPGYGIVTNAFTYSGVDQIVGDAAGYAIEAEVTGTYIGNLEGGVDFARIGLAADGFTLNSFVNVKLNRMNAPSVTRDFKVGVHALVQVNDCDFISSNYVPDGPMSLDFFQVQNSRFANLVSFGRRVFSSPIFKGNVGIGGLPSAVFEGPVIFTDAGNSLYVGQVIPDAGGLTFYDARVNLPASVAGRAGLRITPGVGPSAPGDGDVWIEDNEIKLRIGGVTRIFDLASTIEPTFGTNRNAMARWQATITDEKGNVVPNPSIEVRRESDNTIVQLYGNRSGTVPIGNPFFGDSSGFAYFHAPGSSYRITASKGAFSKVWRYVGISLFSEQNDATSLRTVTAATDTLLDTDLIVYVNHAGAVTLTLPSAAAWSAILGRDVAQLVIQDISGAASSSNITINRAGSDTINGGTSTSIASDYGVKRLTAVSTTAWVIQ